MKSSLDIWSTWRNWGKWNLLLRNVFFLAFCLFRMPNSLALGVVSLYFYPFWGLWNACLFCSGESLDFVNKVVFSVIRILSFILSGWVNLKMVINIVKVLSLCVCKLQVCDRTHLGLSSKWRRWLHFSLPSTWSENTQTQTLTRMV